MERVKIILKLLFCLLYYLMSRLGFELDSKEPVEEKKMNSII